MPENKKKLYDALSGIWNLGTFDKFCQDIEDEQKRRKLYDAASKEFDLGDYDSFSNQLGYGQQAKPVVEDQTQAVRMDTLAVPSMQEKPEAPTDTIAPVLDRAILPTIEQQKPSQEEDVTLDFDDEPNGKPHEDTIRGFFPALAQGAKNMYYGTVNLLGEAAQSFSGRNIFDPLSWGSRNAQEALHEIDRRLLEGIDPRRRYNDPEYQEYLDTIAQDPNISDKEKRKYLRDHQIGMKAHDEYFNSLKEQAGSYNKAVDRMQHNHDIDLMIAEAFKQADGDVNEARRILAQKATDLSLGDRLMSYAASGLAQSKETKGFGAWLGQQIPMILPTAAAIGLSASTRNPKYAEWIGKGSFGIMAASSAGEAMNQARQYGATDNEVWSAGLADAAIMYAAGKIPFNRYTGRLFNTAKNQAAKNLSAALADENSLAAKEAEELFNRAAKELGSKFNFKTYLADIAAHGATMGSMSAMQTMVPMIYEHPEDYPTLTNILENSLAGFRDGVFLGATLGAATQGMQIRNNRARWKNQGGIMFAEMESDGGEPVMVEVIGIDGRAIRRPRDWWNQKTDEFVKVDRQRKASNAGESDLESFDTGDGGTVEILVDGKLESISKAEFRKRLRSLGRKSFAQVEEAEVQYQTDNAFEEGYDVHEPSERHDTQNMYEYQRKLLQDKTGLDDVSEENVMSYYESGNWTPEQKETILDYLKAKAARRGMIEGIRDDISRKIVAATTAIDDNTSKTDGMVHPATLKDDRRVYVVDGNVVMLEDGTGVDLSRSQHDLLVRDAETGELFFVPSEQFLSVDEALDPTQEKQVVAEQIRNGIAQEAADQIDGIVSFNPGDTYTLLTDEGHEVPVTVAMNEQGVVDNGDGTVNVVINNGGADGSPVLTPMPKDQIQSRVNAYNLKRLDDYIGQLDEMRNQMESTSSAATEEKPSVEVPAPESTEEPEQSAIPVDEQGRKQYMQAPQEASYEDIYSDENFESDDEAYGFISGKVKRAELELKNYQAAVADIKPEDFDSPAEYRAAKNGAIEMARPFQEAYDYWKGVQDLADADIAAANERTARMENAEEAALLQPNTVEDVAADGFQGMEHKLDKEDFKRETGMSDAQMKKFFPFWAKDGKGMSVQELANFIAANDKTGLAQDARAVRNAVVSVMRSASRPADIYDRTFNSYIARQERMAQESAIAAEDAVRNEPEGTEVPESSVTVEQAPTTPTQQAIAQAEAQVNTEPTEGQKEAGNYRMGHVKVDGFDISIENPKGSVRRGVSPDGKAWETKMNNTYGYIRRTEGPDGDHIDVFLSDNPEQGNVFVVDQVDPKTGQFDEHKVMYGFNSADEARAAYLSNYEKGWKGLGNITEVSREEFKKWVDSSHRKTKPFAEYKSVKPVEQTPQVETMDPQSVVDVYSQIEATKAADKGKPGRKEILEALYQANPQLVQFRNEQDQRNAVSDVIALARQYPDLAISKAVLEKVAPVENAKSESAVSTSGGRGVINFDNSGAPIGRLSPEESYAARKKTVLDQTQARLDDLQGRMDQATEAEQMDALIQEKVGIIREMMESLGADKVDVQTRGTIAEKYREDGASEEYVGRLERFLRITKRLKERLRGFFGNERVYIIADDIESAIDALTTYRHEDKHDENRRTGAPGESLKTGITRGEMVNAIYYFTRSHDYDNEAEVSLADELIANAAEIAETNGIEAIPDEFRKAGIFNEDFITFVQKNIEDGTRRNGEGLHSGRGRSLQSVDSQVDGGQDVRDHEAGAGQVETVPGTSGGSRQETRSGEGQPDRAESGDLTPEQKREIIASEGVSSIGQAALVDESGVKLSIRTEEDVERKIREFAKSKEAKSLGWTDEAIEGIISETADLIRAIHAEVSGNKYYDEWAQRNPTVKVDWRDGVEKPTVTWSRANIEYKYDMSADLLCINNEGLETVLANPTMVDLMLKINEPAKNYKEGFTSDDYLRLYETLRDMGFVVPCKGCFDAAVRLKMLPTVSKKFIERVNQIIDERNADPEAFDKKVRASAGSDATITGLPGSAHNIEEAIRTGVVGDNLTEHINWAQLMSAEGQTKALSDWSGIFRAWERTGAGRPKDKLLPEPWSGDIVSTTTTIIGKFGEKTPSYRDINVNQGTGLRRNSHSEFRPILAIDEIQFMREAFIRGLTVFKYMKELDDVRLFGKLGVKFNMSFFPAFVEGAPAAGLDMNGDYIAAEESVGGREFEYIGEDGKTHYDGMKGWKEAQKYLNKDVSLSSVVFSIPHLIKALTDVPTAKDPTGMWGSLIPFHATGATATSLKKQGLGQARALGLGHGFEEAMTDYGKGVTNFEAVQNDRFGEGWKIVDGKKAGTDVEPGHKLEFSSGTHYYNESLGLHLFSSFYIYDNELKKKHYDKNGKVNADKAKADGHPYSVDYNDKVREIGTDTAYKDAADFYIQTLREIGLVPRFDFEVPEETFLKMCADAKVDPNHPKLGWKGPGNAWSPVDSDAYYSLFCDYGMIDPKTGKLAPHNPVGVIDENGNRVFRLPDNAIDIIRDGIERYGARKSREEGRVLDAIEEFAKRTVAEGKLSQEDADAIVSQAREEAVNTSAITEAEGGEESGFRPSIRSKEPPKNTDTGYKVFFLKDGKLYPPMVANPDGAATPVGVWLDADAAPVAGISKTGRKKVQAGGKGTQGGSGQLSYRPGWHLGTIPYALQFNRGPKVDNPLGITNQKGEIIQVGEFFPKDFVWAEVEYSKDKDYQEEAMSYGYNKNGNFEHAKAGLPRIPEDGSYLYRTNANPATDPWIITGAMRVKGILTPSQVDDLVRKAGRDPQKRQEGAVTDEMIKSLNEQLGVENTEPDGPNGGTRFSIKGDVERTALDLYDRFNNQDGEENPWMSENELISRIEEELPYGVKTKDIFSKIDEYRRLDEEDFEEGRRDFSGSEKMDVFNEILSDLQKLSEGGEPRFSVKADPETEKLFDAAKERFGTTRDLREAGYVLPDGTLLDFSGRHWQDPNSDTSWLNGSRQVDHRDIEDLNFERDMNTPSGLKTDMSDFIRRGAIRIHMPGSINLYSKPTPQQRPWLQRLINADRRFVRVDFGDGNHSDHYADYENANPSKILFDIDGYFDEGIKPEGNAPMFSIVNRNQDVFVSNAEASLDRIKMEKATPEQWLKMLEKEGGLKAGEDKWIGLSDWIKSQNKKSLTKQEIADYIAEHRIQIEEVHYSEGKGLEDQIDKKYPGFSSAFGIDNSYQAGEIWVKDREKAERLYEQVTGEDAEELFESDLEEFAMDLAKEVRTDRAIDGTRMGYTTEGLDNKREIALTVPTIEPWNQGDEVHFGDAGEGRAIAWIRFGETTTEKGTGNAPIEVKYVGTKPTSEAMRRAVEGVLINWNDQESLMRNVEHEDQFATAKSMYENAINDNFYSLNDNEKALAEETLASLKALRPADFEAVYERGGRVLVIDEIQSKRHQEGRERGYASPMSEEEKRARKEEYDKVAKEMSLKYGTGVMGQAEFWDEVNPLDKERILEVREKYREIEKSERGVRPAPFEKNWHELAMKRMLRLAAEEGYDYVAWTTGEQQAERYNIGNYVSSIDRTEADEGERAFGLYLGDSDASTEVVTDENGTIIRAEGNLSQSVGRPLGDLVGKEVAVKMMRMDVDDVLEDVELMVGGEGMKGFYDDILPRYMNKYGKKWGVKVQDIVLPNIGQDALGGIALGMTMHSVPVTKEMKESVMQGQPMFSVQSRFSSDADEFDKTVQDAASKKGIVVDGLSGMTLQIHPVTVNNYDGKSAKTIYKEFVKGKAFPIEDTHPDGFSFYISKDSIQEFVNGDAVDKSVKGGATRDLHYSLLPEIVDVIKKSIDAEIHPDYNKVNNVRNPENGYNDGVLIHRLYGAIEADGKIYRVKTTVKEYRDANRDNKAYAYEVTKIELVDDSSDGATKGSSGPLNPVNNSISATKLLKRVEKSYDPGKKLLSESKKPSFSILSRPVEEIVEEGRQTVKTENDEARAKLNDRMRAIDQTLADLNMSATQKDYARNRMAAAAQREYDRQTVRSVTDLAKRLLDEGALSEPTRREIEKMLTVTRWATGRKDLEGATNAIMDLMVGNQLRHAKGVLDNLLKIRGSKVDARGVEVQGKLDVPGQRLMQVFKDAMDMAPDAIEEHIAAAKERMDSEDDAVKSAAGDEVTGLTLAQEYAANVRASIDEEKGIKNELRQAAEDRRAGKMSLASYREFVQSCEDSLRQNRIDRIKAYDSITGRLANMLYDSIARGKTFREEEERRIERIHHFANSDLQGQKSDEHGDKNDRLTNSSLIRFFLKPLATFDQMLRYFGSKSVNGEGYLWNHFMRGWVDANDAEYQGMKAATDELDRKVSDVFGRKMRWSDLYSVERKMPTVDVQFWDGGKMKDHKLTQGNLLYIYMVNKMSDGRMKLRRMGIEQEHVDAIARQMDPRFLELADWIQDEFLPNVRNKYNRVHEKLFGAPMAAIENYFPLKVLANARVREVDMATPDTDGTTPATITGSIIKRRKNALALDILGTDAFSLVIEHLEQMEHWAAFAPFNQDLNTLLSYKTFRNKVQNMSSIYGAGSIIWENFRKSAEIAAGVYRPAASKDSIDTAAVNIAKGVTAAKISFRVYTAIKQLLSMPAFISDASIVSLGKSMVTPWKSWNWALKELPGFQKRWLSRQAGDTRLMQTDSDWKMWRNNLVKTASRLGMSPNAFVDALTVSIGAKAMYETRRKKYIEDGYTEEQADKRAKQDATILFNETQQSNESAFLSAMQLDRTWASVALTVFRNSSMGYQRQLVDAVRNLGRKFTSGYKDQAVEFMTKQMVRDGVDEEDARDAAERNYRKSTFRDALRVAIFGFVMQFAWNLGKSLPYLLAGDDDDEKKKMIKDAARQGLLGGTVEGLTGGSVISEAANMLASGEGLKNYDPSLMPVVSDIQRVINMASYDQVAAANEILNIMIQAGVGVNPQTLTDIGVAIYDACHGDLDTSKEATLLLMRILQCPQSQIDKVFTDEMDLTAEKGLDLTIGKFAERYADYKVRRGAPLSGWAYPDELREKRINSYEKKFTKQAQELIRTRGNDIDRAYYEYVDTEHKEVEATLRDLRSNARDAAQSGDQMGAMEYAGMLNDFMQTPEYKRYEKAHGSVNAIKKLQTALKKSNDRSRDAIEDQILQLKKQMVNELERTDNK